MPPADQGKRAQIAVQYVAQRASDPHVATMNTEILNSLAFRYNGQELVTAVPTALTCIGATYVVMSSDAAQKITLDPGKDQFRYIGYKKLQSALGQCCALGQETFISIQRSMEFIKQISGSSQQTANDLIEVLGDPEAVQKMLKPFFGKLRSGSGQCYIKAKEMDEAIDQWLLCACELHAVCASMDSTNEEKLQAISIDRLACRARVNYESEKGSSTKGFTANLEKQMMMTGAAFQNISGSFPAGWTVLDQQVMTGLVDSFVTALNQTLLVIHENVIPMVKVDPGVGLFKSRIVSSRDSTADKTTPPPIPQPQQPKYSSDPAFSQVVRDMPYFVLAQQILSSGPNGSVNWTIARADAAQAVRLVDEALTSTAKNFATIASTEEPSVKYRNAITAAKQVMVAIINEVQRGDNPPANDSSIIKEWKTSFAKAYDTALEMFAFAKTLPGIVQSLPLMSNNEFDGSQKLDNQSAQAQAFVDSVANSTYAAMQASTSTAAVYKKSVEVLSKQQKSLGGIQVDLKSLSDPKATFAQIKKVLLDTIITIITIKKEVAKFVRCCKAVDQALGIVGTYAVDPLTESFRNNNISQLGGYTMLDLQRSNFLGSILWYTAYSKVLAYYYAAGWLSMFTEIGMQGLRIVGTLAQISPDNGDGGMRMAVGNLSSWADMAQSQVSEATNKWREDVTTSMQDRLETLTEETKVLPPSPAASKAIELGSETVRTVAEEALDANFNNSTLARFVSK